MSADKYEIASIIEYTPERPVVLSLAFQSFVSGGLRDTLKNAKLVQKALSGDALSALSVKEALFHDASMVIDDCPLQYPRYGVSIIPRFGAASSLGKSDILAHAIMAALIRASGWAKK